RQPACPCTRVWPCRPPSRSPTFELRGLLFTDRPQRLFVVGAHKRDQLERRRVVEGRRHRLLEQLVDRQLRVPDRQRGSGGQPSRERQRLGLQLVVRDRGVDQTHPLGFGGGQGIAGQQITLGTNRSNRQRPHDGAAVT